jgi:hypothetical protein
MYLPERNKFQIKVIEKTGSHIWWSVNFLLIPEIVEKIKQKRCYENIFELPCSTNNRGLQNTTAVKEEENKTLYWFHAALKSGV